MANARPPAMNHTLPLPSQAARPLRVVNTEDADAPPYAALEVHGWDSTNNAFRVRKCTVTGRNDLIFNGHTTILAGGEGQAWAAVPITAGYVTTLGAAPEPNQVWGVEAGGWVLCPDFPGYVVRDVSAAAVSVFIVEPDRYNRTEFVRVVGGAVGGFLDAELVIFDPRAGVEDWTATEPTTTAVWFRDVYGRPGVSGPGGEPCVAHANLVGFAADRPVYVGVGCADLDSGTGSGPPPDFEAGGPGWVAGLCRANCLVATVAATHGICEGVSQGQASSLTSSDGDEWVSAGGCGFTPCADGGSGSGGSLSFSFRRDGGSGLPTLEVGGGRLIYAGAGRVGGVAYVDFAGGRDLCGGCPPAAAVPCDGSGSGSGSGPECRGPDGGCGSNYFVVRVSCGGCPPAGFAGSGWYCVAAGCCSDSGASRSPVEILCGDAGDQSYQICSGPYATEAAALAVCGPILCGCSNPIPGRLYATGSAGVGTTACACAVGLSVPMDYDPDLGYWIGSKSCSNGGCLQAYTVKLECIAPPHDPRWRVTVTAAASGCADCSGTGTVAVAVTANETTCDPFLLGPVSATPWSGCTAFQCDLCWTVSETEGTIAAGCGGSGPGEA